MKTLIEIWESAPQPQETHWAYQMRHAIIRSHKETERLRAALHIQALYKFPNMSHEEIIAEIDRIQSGER